MNELKLSNNDRQLVNAIYVQCEEVRCSNDTLEGKIEKISKYLAQALDLSFSSKDFLPKVDEGYVRCRLCPASEDSNPSNSGELVAVMIPPGGGTQVHNHCGSNTNVIIVTHGSECNAFFKRDGDSVVEIDSKTISKGSVYSLDESAIHQVSNMGNVDTVAIHYYACLQENCEIF